MAPKYDSEYMNEILNRLGCVSDHAIPGQPIAPTFYRMFTALIDRIEALEARVTETRSHL